MRERAEGEREALEYWRSFSGYRGRCGGNKAEGKWDECGCRCGWGGGGCCGGGVLVISDGAAIPLSDVDGLGRDGLHQQGRLKWPGLTWG